MRRRCKASTRHIGRACLCLLRHRHHVHQCQCGTQWAQTPDHQPNRRPMRRKDVKKLATEDATSYRNGRGKAPITSEKSKGLSPRNQGHYAETHARTMTRLGAPVHDPRAVGDNARREARKARRGR